MTRRRGQTSARDNRGALLDLIRSAGSISRVEIAARSGLTEATVSRIVKQLVQSGIVIETGRGSSTGGKRPTLLELNRTSRYAAGILLSERRTTYVLTDLSGAVVASEEAAGTSHIRRGDVAATAPDVIDSLLTRAKAPRDALLGIGVAIPGREEYGESGPRPDPEWRPEWDWAAVEKALEASTGRPISVENDSTCAAIGEFWTTRGSAASDFAVVNLASGIGFGLVTAGDVYRGATSNVGELGHVILDVNGPECTCGSRGCLEMLAASRAIVGRAREDAQLAQDLALSGAPEDAPDDYDRIARASANGDERAAALIADAARLLGKALVSVTNVLDLERIVLTGPALDHVGAEVTRVVGEELADHAYVRRIHPTRVQLSRNGRLASSIGAASLAIHEQLGGFRRTAAPQEPADHHESTRQGSTIG